MNKKGFCFPKRARTSINVEYNYTHKEYSCISPSCCHTFPTISTEFWFRAPFQNDDHSMEISHAFSFFNIIFVAKKINQARTKLRELIRDSQKGHACSFVYV